MLDKTTTTSEPFQRSGFDWSLLKSTSKLVRIFPAHSTIVESDVVNHSLFLLEEGEVRFEYGDGSSFGGLTSKNDWPIFCELSGMGLEQGKTLFRVVAEVDCRVRILSMESMYSVLFRGGKGGEEMEKRAVSFFETLLRHYASTLHSLLTLDSTYPSSSSNPPLYSGRGECCSSVFDEAVVFTWKCSFLRKGGEEGLVCLTASYLALIRDPSRKTKTIVGEDGEKTDVLHIKSIKSISHDSKQRVKIELKNDHKISFFLRRSDAEVLEEALGFGGKHEGEKEKKKGKRGGGGGVKDPKVGSEEGFAIPSGLTGGDFRRLTEVGEVQNVEKGKVLCVEGLEINELLYIMEGTCFTYSSSTGKGPTIDSNNFVGEFSYVLNAQPHETVVSEGCILLRLPFSFLISFGRTDGMFLVRLYQSLVDQLRSRIIKYHETNGENRKLAKKKAGSRRKPPPLPPLPSPLGNTQDSSVPLCPRTTSGRGPGREAKALEGTERHVSTDRGPSPGVPRGRRGTEGHDSLTLDSPKEGDKKAKKMGMKMGMKPGVPLRRGLNPSSSAPYSSSSSTRRSSPLPIQPSSTLSCNLSCSPSSSSSSCTSSSPTSSPILSPRSPTSTIISFGEEEADICSIKSKFMKCIECNLWYCEFCQQSASFNETCPMASKHSLKRAKTEGEKEEPIRCGLCGAGLDRRNPYPENETRERGRCFLCFEEFYKIRKVEEGKNKNSFLSNLNFLDLSESNKKMKGVLFRREGNQKDEDMKKCLSDHNINPHKIENILREQGLSFFSLTASILTLAGVEDYSTRCAVVEEFRRIKKEQSLFSVPFPDKMPSDCCHWTPNDLGKWELGEVWFPERSASSHNPPSSASCFSLCSSPDPESIIAMSNSPTSIFECSSSSSLISFSSGSLLNNKPTPKSTVRCIINSINSPGSIPNSPPSPSDVLSFSDSSPFSCSLPPRMMSPTKTISKQRSVLAEHSSPISPPSSPPASPLFPPLDPYDIETILDNLMTLSEERIIAFFTAFEQFQIDKESLLDGFKKLLQNRKTSALKVLEVWRTTCDADYSKNFPEFSTKMRSLLSSHQFSAEKLFFELSDPRTVAQSITSLFFETFSAITPSELHDGAWEKNPEKRAPNILKMTQMFNILSNLIIESLLFCSEDVRHAALEWSIRLSQELVKLQNFDAAAAVLCGLNNSCIKRIKSMWLAIHPKYRKRYEMLDDLISPQKNFKKYMGVLRSAQPPLLPWIAPKLRELRFFYDGNAKMTEDGEKFDFELLLRVGESINEILKFQRYPYQFVSSDLVRLAFKNAPLDERKEDQQNAYYKRSLQIEPKTQSVLNPLLTEHKGSLDLLEKKKERRRERGERGGERPENGEVFDMKRRGSQRGSGDFGGRKEGGEGGGGGGRREGGVKLVMVPGKLKSSLSEDGVRRGEEGGGGGKTPPMLRKGLGNTSGGLGKYVQGEAVVERSQISHAMH